METDKQAQEHGKQAHCERGRGSVQQAYTVLEVLLLKFDIYRGWHLQHAVHVHDGMATAAVTHRAAEHHVES